MALASTVSERNPVFIFSLKNALEIKCDLVVNKAMID